MALIRPKLPDQPALVILLRNLLDREVRLDRDEPVAPEGYTAVYIDRDDRPTAVVTFDLPLAATAGAALALIPAPTAEEWIATGSLDPDALDNASEVLNVLASAFNTVDDTRHVRLATVVPPGESSADVDDVMARAMARARFSVQVAGYPSGWVQLAAA